MVLVNRTGLRRETPDPRSIDVCSGWAGVTCCPATLAGESVTDTDGRSPRRAQAEYSVPTEVDEGVA